MAQCSMQVFQSAPRVRGESCDRRQARQRQHVSIRAPRAGRKTAISSVASHGKCFNPRPACGAKESLSDVVNDLMKCFNPRPACGAKAWCCSLMTIGERFNPRPACGAKEQERTASPARHTVSIRAPRAGRKAADQSGHADSRGFNPRPACGAKAPVTICGTSEGVFQSAPRVRGERPCTGLNSPHSSVSIRAPRAGRKGTL